MDQEKVNAINEGKSYIKHIKAETISQLTSVNALEHPLILAKSKCDAVLICVPTPLGKHREPDISYILKQADPLLHFSRLKMEIQETYSFRINYLPRNH